MLVAAALLTLAETPSTVAAQLLPPAVATAKSRPFPLPDDAVGYIPANAGPHPPVLVLLHGAGRTRLWMIEHLKAQADARGIVLLAPTSRGVTWDTVLVAESPPSPDSPVINSQSHRFSRSKDADRVEQAIANLAKIVPVDRTRTVLAGFSDGATFALAMGMSKDHQFAAVFAWSPGIAIETEQPARGRRVFVSHGREDQVLSYGTDCGEIVPLLQSEGAKVSFLPFDGAHEVPEAAKDTFLDAVFGPVPGAPAHPLPSSLPICHSGTGTTQMPVYR